MQTDYGASNSSPAKSQAIRRVIVASLPFFESTVTVARPLLQVLLRVGVSRAKVCLLRLQFDNRPAEPGTRKKRACFEWILLLIGTSACCKSIVWEVRSRLEANAKNPCSTSVGLKMGFSSILLTFGDEFVLEQLDALSWRNPNAKRQSQ
jgi:hypothetical protein